MADSEVGGVYEVHASVLRGSWLCGGSLGISKAGGCGSGLAFAVFWSSLEAGLESLGARPLRFHFVSARPIFSYRSEGLALRFARVTCGSLRALTTILIGHLGLGDEPIFLSYRAVFVSR